MSFARLSSLRRLFDVGRIFAVQTTLRRANHTIDLSDSVVQQYLRHLVGEFSELRSRTQLGRVERSRLLEISPIVNVLDERILLHESIDSLKELNSQENKDEELRKQIAEEATLYMSRLKEIDGELLAALLETPLPEGGALVEVSAGAGGQEAMLFAGELLNMYEGYARHRGWQLDVASLERSELGGVRRGSLLVAGVGVWELMRLEAGVHRVQRTPSTERAGRVHTSTATVAVLPQPTQLELELNERDLRVETKRASGAGGQHVNTTDSAVRLTHLPTGTTVECQEDRSQIKNKLIAMQKLRALLLQRSRDALASEINAQRKSQVGSGERNEKIRTYNFPQDRVTEHGAGGEATGSVHDLRGFLAGGEPLARVHDTALRRLRYRHLVDEIERLGRAAPAVAADR